LTENDEPKTIEAYLLELADSDFAFNIDELADELKDNKFFQRAFSPDQIKFLSFILKRIAFNANFHEYDDSAPHDETIGKEIVRLEKKLENHRHETGKTFSAKPEF
jgi:hypothetical protein